MEDEKILCKKTAQMLPADEFDDEHNILFKFFLKKKSNVQSKHVDLVALVKFNGRVVYSQLSDETTSILVIDN